MMPGRLTAGRALRLARRLWTEFGLLVTDVRQVPETLLFTRRTGRTAYLVFIWDYDRTSAGIAACHRLVHELNEGGFAAFSTGAVNTRWNERRLSRFGSYLLVRLGHPIVLYPEAIPRNPLGSKRVVRWVLNFPGVMGGEDEFHDSELVYTWSSEFYDTENQLCVDIVEREIFNDKDLPSKEIDCFYIGKGPLRGVHPIPLTDGMTQITREWPAKRGELAELLRRTKVLYTYDDLTMLATEALLCGCKVVLLPEHEDIRMDENRFSEQDYENQLNRFIADTQSHWAQPAPAGRPFRRKLRIRFPM